MKSSGQDFIAKKDQFDSQDESLERIRKPVQMIYSGKEQMQTWDRSKLCHLKE